MPRRPQRGGGGRGARLLRDVEDYLREPTGGDRAAVGSGDLFWPGGSGGGGRRRSRTTAGAVVKPHPRTSPQCTRCGRYHTKAEHARHRDAPRTTTRTRLGSKTRKKKSTPGRERRVLAAPKSRPSAKMLTLPSFELLKRQPRVPHVSRVVAQRGIANEHGAIIAFRVEQSRNGRDWWISASLDGLRMSNTLHTSVPARAQDWIGAVTSGRIRVADPVPLVLPRHPATALVSGGEPLDLVLAAVASAPEKARVGDGVFISEVYRRVGRQIGMTLVQFKRWLVDQNRQQHLTLVRMDLVDTVPARLVAASEIDDLGDQFHLIVDPSRRGR